MRILLIDDEPADLKNCKALILKYIPLAQVLTAYDGISAKDVLEEEFNSGRGAPDLIIVDVWLPGPEHGVELISNFVQDSRITSTIFGLSVAESEEVKARCLAAEVDGYFTKGIDDEQLAIAVTQLVGGP